MYLSKLEYNSSSSTKGYTCFIAILHLCPVFYIQRCLSHSPKLFLKGIWNSHSFWILWKLWKKVAKQTELTSCLTFDFMLTPYYNFVITDDNHISSQRLYVFSYSIWISAVRQAVCGHHHCAVGIVCILQTGKTIELK